MTYTNSAVAFNLACTSLEAAAGVDHYFQILANPEGFNADQVDEAQYLDSWDCYLLDCEDELA